MSMSIDRVVVCFVKILWVKFKTLFIGEFTLFMGEF